MFSCQAKNLQKPYAYAKGRFRFFRIDLKSFEGGGLQTLLGSYHFPYTLSLLGVLVGIPGGLLIHPFVV